MVIILLQHLQTSTTEDNATHIGTTDHNKVYITDTSLIPASPNSMFPPNASTPTPATLCHGDHQQAQASTAESPSLVPVTDQFTREI